MINILNENIRPIHSIICRHHSIPNCIVTLISYIIYKKYIIGKINNTGRFNTNMYAFISRELLYRHTTFKYMHWFEGNIQKKTFEVALENMFTHS